MKKAIKVCKGCKDEFTISTAEDETNYCSQLCENGKYPFKKREKREEKER